MNRFDSDFFRVYKIVAIRHHFTTFFCNRAHSDNIPNFSVITILVRFECNCFSRPVTFRLKRRCASEPIQVLSVNYSRSRANRYGPENRNRANGGPITKCLQGSVPCHTTSKRPRYARLFVRSSVLLTDIVRLNSAQFRKYCVYRNFLLVIWQSRPRQPKSANCLSAQFFSEFWGI